MDARGQRGDQPWNRGHGRGPVQDLPDLRQGAGGLKILVTGITGFLGSHVAEQLLAAGHDVVGLAREPGRLDPDLKRWLPGHSTREDPPAMVRDGQSGARPVRAILPPSAAPRADHAGPHQVAGRNGLDAGRTHDRGASALGSLRMVQGSLSDSGSLDEAASGVDAVVHVAGLILARTEEQYLRVNRDGTEAVLRALERRGSSPLRRFVLISSQAAGGPTRGGLPVSGEDPAQPISAYGRSKRAGEERALERSHTLPVTILRPPVVFGSRDRMLGRLFKAVQRGRAAVWGDGEHAFQVVHAPDAARACLLAIERSHPSGSIFYTADEQVFTWRSFIDTLASRIGVRVRLLRVPPPVFTLVAGVTTTLSFVTGRPPLLPFDKLDELREPSWLCSSREAREVLGWTPSCSVEDALARTHEWYRQRGLL